MTRQPSLVARRAVAATYENGRVPNEETDAVGRPGAD